MNILGQPTHSAETAQAWARSRSANPLYVSLAPIYWRFAPVVGVRPEVAYAQCAKETGFCRFGGVIDSTFCNPCGLKTKDGGANSDPDAHQRFPTWEVGVQAHVDHLALYAGALGYPRTQTFDPRHFEWVFGKAATVEALGGAWAPSDSYGTNLLADYVAPLLAQAPVDPPAYALRAEVDGALSDLRAMAESLRNGQYEVETKLEALPTEADLTAAALDAVEERLHAAISGMFS